MRQILELIKANPERNIYSLMGSVKRGSLYSYLGRYVKWGYIKRLKPGVFVLTEKGKAILRRLMLGRPSCPLCGYPARRNGTRNGKQRWKCARCGFHFTSGCVENLVKSLKKRGKSVFLIYSEPWEANRLYLTLKAWIKEKRIDGEFKSVFFVEI